MAKRLGQSERAMITRTATRRPPRPLREQRGCEVFSAVNKLFLVYVVWADKIADHPRFFFFTTKTANFILFKQITPQLSYISFPGVSLGLKAVSDNYQINILKVRGNVWF